MVETEEGFSYSDNYSLYLHILALLWDTIIKINFQKEKNTFWTFSWHMVCLYDNYSLGIWEKAKPLENMLFLIVVFLNDKNNNLSFCKYFYVAQMALIWV